MRALASTLASRGALSEAVSRARWRGERTVITVRGKPAAALVPLADLEQLEQQTTRADVRTSAPAIAAGAGEK